MGDVSSGESSATIEIDPSLGVDGTISKSFTLTGQDIKNAASAAVHKVKGIFED